MKTKKNYEKKNYSLKEMTKPELLKLDRLYKINENPYINKITLNRIIQIN